jgi:hypothetical protein
MGKYIDTSGANPNYSYTKQAKWYVKDGGNKDNITDWVAKDDSGNVIKDKWVADSKGWLYADKNGKLIKSGAAEDSNGMQEIKDGYWTGNKYEEPEEKLEAPKKMSGKTYSAKTYSNKNTYQNPLQKSSIVVGKPEDYLEQASKFGSTAYQQALDNVAKKLASDKLAYEGQIQGTNASYDDTVTKQNQATKMSKNNYSDSVLGRGMQHSTIATTGLGEMDMLNNQALSDIETERNSKLNAIRDYIAQAEENASTDTNTLKTKRNDDIAALAYQYWRDQQDQKYKEDALYSGTQLNYDTLNSGNDYKYDALNSDNAFKYDSLNADTAYKYDALNSDNWNKQVNAGIDQQNADTNKAQAEAQTAYYKALAEKSASSGGGSYGSSGYGTGSTGTSGQTSGTASGSDISQVQKLLNSAGFNAGTEDGVMGGNTSAAIKRFQYYNNLPQTGTLDSKTLALMQNGGYNKMPTSQNVTSSSQLGTNRQTAMSQKEYDVMNAKTGNSLSDILNSIGSGASSYWNELLKSKSSNW